MFQQPTQPQPVGQVLDSGFKLYGAGLRSVVPLSGAYGLLSAIPSIAVHFGPAFKSIGPAGIALVVIVALFGWLLALALSAAMIVSIGSIARGETMPVGEAFQRGLRLGPRYLGTLLLYALVCMAGMFLLIIPGLFLLGSLMLSPYLALIDDASPADALRRSHNLVWGNWWRSMLIVMVPVLVMMAVSTGLMIPLGVAAGVSGMDPEGLTMQLGTELIQLVTNIITMPLIVAVSVALLNDLKLRKEGGDLAARLEEVHGRLSA